jgi:para-nitrobenzyl esterase
MKQDWATMARAGSPAPGWPRFSRAGQQALSLVPPRPQVETGFAAEHQCAFWALGASS